MPSQTTAMLQIVDRETGRALTPVEDRVVEWRDHEPEYLLEDRIRRDYLRETEQKIKHMPIMRKKLAGRAWCIDCILV